MLLRRAILSSGVLGDAGITEFPETTSLLAVPFGLGYNAWIDNDLLNQRRTSDSNPLNIGNNGSPNYLFDSSAWSTHTSAGADPGVASDVYDQNGTNDFVQSTAANQPLVNSDGTLTFDGISDLMTSGVRITSGTAFSITIVYRSSNIFSATETLFGFGSLGSQDFLAFATTSVLAFRSDPGAQTVSTAKAPLDDNGWKCLTVTYNGSGVVANLNNSNLTIGGTMTGTLNTNNFNLAVGANLNGTSHLDMDVRLVAVNSNTTWNSSQITGIYNWVNDRGLLT